MDHTKHLTIITAHHPLNEIELSFKQATLAFVQHHDNFYKRTLECGHVTASAWITNPARSHALMLHHKKLDRWLQPGGHIEQDSDVLAAALREAKEETGINNMRVVSDAIFDIDIHMIPANSKEAEHQHFDIRYLFETALDTMPIVSDESNDVRWFSLEKIAIINDDTSIQRMILKTIMLRDKAD